MSVNKSELRKRVLKHIKVKAGLSMPKTPSQEASTKEFTSDLTRLSEMELRREMSHWKSMLGYVNTFLARSQVDEKSYKRSVKSYEREYKWRNKSDKNTAMWEIEAGLSQEKEYDLLVNKLEQCEAIVIVVKSLRDAYEGYYDVCSRELTARMGEMSGRID